MQHKLLILVIHLVKEAFDLLCTTNKLSTLLILWVWHTGVVKQSIKRRLIPCYGNSFGDKTC